MSEKREYVTLITSAPSEDRLFLEFLKLGQISTTNPNIKERRLKKKGLYAVLVATWSELEKSLFMVTSAYEENSVLYPPVSGKIQIVGNRLLFPREFYGDERLTLERQGLRVDIDNQIIRYLKKRGIESEIENEGVGPFKKPLIRTFENPSEIDVIARSMRAKMKIIRSDYSTEAGYQKAKERFFKKMEFWNDLIERSRNDLSVLNNVKI